MTEQNDILENNTENMEMDTEVEAETETDEHVCRCAEQLEREKAQLNQQLLRMKADFDNYKRRAKLQMEENTRDANKQLLVDLLPILDNFERALASGSGCQEQDSFFLGVEMVYQGLMAALANHGLKPIAAVGDPFDPCLHEAIAMEETEGDGGLVVLNQIQTGYLLHEKVLRHTKVLVGQNKEEDICQK